MGMHRHVGKILAAGHVMAFVSFCLAVFLLACEPTDREWRASVSWKVENLNGLDIVFYRCQLKREGAVIETLRICDSKQECNDYCDKFRSSLPMP